MNKLALPAVVAAGLVLPASASAANEISVSQCKPDNTVDVEFFPPEGWHGGQVNVDGVFVIEDWILGPTPKGYTVTVGPGQHKIDAVLADGNSTYRLPDGPVTVNCALPAPLQPEVRVQVVEKPVEVVRYVDRVVTTTVTKRVRARCDLKIKNGKKIYYNCRKRALPKTIRRAQKKRTARPQHAG